MRAAYVVVPQHQLLHAFLAGASAFALEVQILGKLLS